MYTLSAWVGTYLVLLTPNRRVPIPTSFIKIFSSEESDTRIASGDDSRFAIQPHWACISGTPLTHFGFKSDKNIDKPN